MKRLAILACVLLAGCATGKWYSTKHSDPAQFEQDRRECEYDARKATVAIRSGIEAGYEQGNLTRMCMETRGYVWKRD